MLVRAMKNTNLAIYLGQPKGWPYSDSSAVQAVGMQDRLRSHQVCDTSAHP